MRTRSTCIRMLVLLSLLALTAACGGGGGGGGGVVPQAPLASGVFTKQTSTVIQGNDIIPFYAGDSKSQSLYLASEIGGSGKITTIRLMRSATSASAVTCPNTTIKMGHTTVSALTTTWANNVETGQGAENIVVNNSTITIPAAASNSWIEIPLSTPFDYNGVDNLVVGFERTTACSATVTTRTVPVGVARRAYSFVADSTPGTADYNATTGSLQTIPNLMQFVFSGGDNLVIAADASADNSNYIAPGQAGRTQALILASDITGTGPITGMAIQPDTATVGGMLTGVTVVLAHTAPSVSIGAGFASNRANSTAATTVASNLTYTIPAGHDAPIWIPFNSGSFNYDGSSNILVDIIVSSSTMTYLIDYKGVPDIRMVTTNDPSATVGTMRSRALQPTFRFNGGTMDTIAAAGNTDLHPFYDASSLRRQYLYPASMLGTKGNITKVAFRLANDSVAGSYPNFEVVMGHTVKDSLTTTYASNMTGASVVYSGTFSIPAGMKAGDWIEIPLSTAFAYDGVSNLVVQEATDVGSAQNDVVCYGASVKYTNYHLYGFDRTSATGGGTNNFISAQRLWYSK